jgi:DNA processing protein
VIPRPAWWSSPTTTRETLLALAATRGALPSVTASRLAAGADPASLLGPDSPNPGEVAARLRDLDVRFVLPGDPGWPFAATPPDPPCAWLFVTGPDPPGSSASAGIVGGRKASALRRATARSLAMGLAGAGICVVSGGAVGIDAAAHRGALDGGGHTIVVLGCGLDVPYPRRNLELFRRVREAGGTLLTEHPPGARPLGAHFLPRNRLIAALSGAVVVVQAAIGSGSLSTARAAGSRGAGQVLAVPGSPWDHGAAGCNDLIRDGATLVRGLDDVLEALGVTSGDTTVPGARHPGDGQHTAGHHGDGRPGGGPLPHRRPWPPGASSTAAEVLEVLADGGIMGVAQLAAATRLPPAKVVAALLELELAGFARRSAAGAEAIALPFPPATGAPP